jgi:hypothetical protein
MALSVAVNRPCALNILGFTLGTILEMKRSTRRFPPINITYKEKIKKENLYESPKKISKHNLKKKLYQTSIKSPLGTNIQTSEDRVAWDTNKN